MEENENMPLALLRDKSKILIIAALLSVFLAPPAFGDITINNDVIFIATGVQTTTRTGVPQEHAHYPLAKYSMGIVGNGIVADAMGFWAEPGDNGTVIVKGGTINADIAGGYKGMYYGHRDVVNGPLNVPKILSASHNTVVLSGGTVKGNIYGGFVDAPIIYDSVAVATPDALRATNNTITIEGDGPLDLSAANLYGGYNASPYNNDADIRSGNTLNVKRSGVTVAGLYNFENLNFYLPADLAGGGTMLKVTGEANIDQSKVNVGINGASSPLRAGDTINLIDAGKLTGTPANNNGTVNGTGMQGVTIIYDFKVYTVGNKLIAETLDKMAPPPTPAQPQTSSPPAEPSSSPPAEEPSSPPPVIAGPLVVTSTGVTNVAGQANPRAKALNEGFVSAPALLVQGADFSGGQGLTMATAVAATGGIQPYGGMSAGSIKHDTGSTVELNSFTLTAGLAHGIDLTASKLTVGAFVEYGHGNYDTYNSFNNAAPVHGSGDSDFVGGGILGRLELGKGTSYPYIEGSARVGQVKNDFTAPDLVDFAGTRASYDSDSLYYGAHVGGGYVFGLNKGLSLDCYGRYLWTHQDGDDVTLTTGETINFAEVNSQRTQVGARLTWAMKYVNPYIGAAWEHEFDGEAAASVHGISLGQPSMEGDTGIGEIGITLAETVSKTIGLDLGVQGYTGEKEGIAGTARLTFNW